MRNWHDPHRKRRRSIAHGGCGATKRQPPRRDLHHVQAANRVGVVVLSNALWRRPRSEKSTMLLACMRFRVSDKSRAHAGQQIMSLSASSEKARHVLTVRGICLLSTAARWTHHTTCRQAACHHEDDMRKTLPRFCAATR